MFIFFKSSLLNYPYNVLMILADVFVGRHTYALCIYLLSTPSAISDF